MEKGNLAPCSKISPNALRYPRTSSSSRSSGPPRRIVPAFFESIVMPSIRFEETALSIKACSCMAKSREENCRVYSACRPCASARSAMCQDVNAGIASGFPENRCSVFMKGFLFKRGLMVFRWAGFLRGYSSAPSIPSGTCERELQLPPAVTFGNALFMPPGGSHALGTGPQPGEQPLVLCFFDWVFTTNLEEDAIG